MIKLKTLIEENAAAAGQQPVSTEPQKMTKEDKKMLAKMVAEYNEYGKVLRNVNEIAQVSEKLCKIAGMAENYALRECGDWMQANVAKRHFAELKKLSEGFRKLASECYENNKQMTALYEDMGHIYEKYFEINDPK
jgi:coenzyme F420-reducing hydrogenase alpha subunit